MSMSCPEERSLPRLFFAPINWLATTAPPEARPREYVYYKHVEHIHERHARHGALADGGDHHRIRYSEGYCEKLLDYERDQKTF